MNDRSIYSPKEACEAAGCTRSFILSLERSGTLTPHRHDIRLGKPKPRALVYYDLTQIKILIAAVKLKDFISVKYLRALLKEDRFLLICDALIETLQQLEDKV